VESSFSNRCRLKDVEIVVVMEDSSKRASKERMPECRALSPQPYEFVERHILFVTLVLSMEKGDFAYSWVSLASVRSSSQVRGYHLQNAV